jgi:hypothetical protein
LELEATVKEIVFGEFETKDWVGVAKVADNAPILFTFMPLLSQHLYKDTRELASNSKRANETAKVCMCVRRSLDVCGRT